MNAGDPSVLALGIAWYVVFLFSTVIHEAAHALAAKLGGDETAASQVTLDPMPHIRREPFGMVLVPLLSFAMGGWVMGWASTPYDPTWADRYPHRAARMALAGPLGNLLLVLAATGLIRLGSAQGWFHGGNNTALLEMLFITFQLNVILFTFNLLPVPPLDGSGVVGLFLTESGARRWSVFIRQPGFLMAGMLLAFGGFSRIAGPILSFAVKTLLQP